ncbi:hypothetical protein BGW80DRAFT_477687 [Lactifluus volemus]|nr:hypothetical protein BGW80DRAFT_477687 [Lactifluus volemus]
MECTLKPVRPLTSSCGCCLYAANGVGGHGKTRLSTTRFRSTLGLPLVNVSRGTHPHDVWARHCQIHALLLHPASSQRFYHAHAHTRWTSVLRVMMSSGSSSAPSTWLSSFLVPDTVTSTPLPRVRAYRSKDRLIGDAAPRPIPSRARPSP